MVMQILSVCVAIFLFSAVLEVPRRHLFFAAAMGGVCWWVYVLILKEWESSMSAAFLSTLVVAVLSHILARVRKAPVTVFLVPGILPSVPGAAIYRCVYYLIRNASQVSTHYLVETLQIAGAIAMAIFITDSFFRLFLAYHVKKGDLAGKR
ncbi:MAG: threonine/serine exporter [Lachnospiraceae bacterium]|jgi:uncharacterized membrane protein YjjB (DUF3815 family)|nr:threonine/serine exporter [Lachnospiraceae bacterium]